uniref:Uncharacterized protein n=1 Tax=Rhizophora mucronata TaxID=61149 RepID=A0A2P2L399_RHIMU
MPVVTWVPKIGESNRRPLVTLRPNAPLSRALDFFIQGTISLTVRQVKLQ